jgi:recombination protein RecT
LTFLHECDILQLSKDFDGMAYKTLLRQLISKWGIMSIEMQTAYDGDMAVINDDGTRNYVETDDNVIVQDVDPIPAEAEEIPDAPTADGSSVEAALFG